MAGRSGGENLTTLNCRLFAPMPKRLLLVAGAVPGPRVGTVIIRDALKGRSLMALLTVATTTAPVPGSVEVSDKVFASNSNKAVFAPVSPRNARRVPRGRRAQYLREGRGVDQPAQNRHRSAVRFGSARRTGRRRCHPRPQAAQLRAAHPKKIVLLALASRALRSARARTVARGRLVGLHPYPRPSAEGASSSEPRAACSSPTIDTGRV